MGIMSQLLADEPAKPITKPIAGPSPASSSTSITSTAPTAPLHPLPPPIPCLICDSPSVWESIYRDGIFRCPECDPWPNRSFIGRLLILGTLPPAHNRTVWLPMRKNFDDPAPNLTQGETAESAAELANGLGDDRDGDGGQGGNAAASRPPYTPEAAWDRFYSHPRLLQHIRRDGGLTYAIAPPGRQGDLMLAAAKERARLATTNKT